MSPYTLFGVECSYYAAKTRAHLAYKRVPYVEIQASRKVYAEEILPRVGWPVVPVLVTPEGETVQDTSEMFDLLEARHPEPPALPPDGAGRVLSHLLEFLGDEWLKLPAMHFRWNHNYDFIVEEFGRNNDPELPRERQIDIGRKIAPRFHGWLPPLGITEESIPFVESDYLIFLALFDAHLATSPYLLGAAPTLGDFAFYGPLYAHLFRDPTSGAIMAEHAPRVVDWILRMQPGAPDAEPLAAATVLTPTLAALLGHMLRDFVPITVAAMAELQHWLATHPGDEELPRQVGEHRVTFGRGTLVALDVTRAIFPYEQWMLQRVQDCYAALHGEAREQAKALLGQIGAKPLVGIPLEHRVERRGFRLYRSGA